METLKFLLIMISGLFVTGFASFAVLEADGIGIPLMLIMMAGSYVTSLAAYNFTPKS